MNILMIFTIIILTFNLWSSEKPIQDIEKGDFVYTQNIETGEVEFKEVLDTFIREVDKLIILELENGDKIETTEEHPFWVVGENDYIEARKLRINDELLLVNQQKVKVRDFKIRILSRVIKVYNFEVEGNHNYFVGSGVLVHNANCGKTDWGDFFKTDKFKNIYNKISDAPGYPKGFKGVQNGTKRVKINNSKAKELLKNTGSKDWKKVYKNGYDEVGGKVSIHYFENKSGKVFNVKTYYEWSVW